MPQPDVNSLLTKHFISQTGRHPDEATGRNSCGFNGDQFVLYAVHLDQSRANRRMFEMQGDSLYHVGSEFIPGFGFGVAERVHHPESGTPEPGAASWAEAARPAFEQLRSYRRILLTDLFN